MTLPRGFLWTMEPAGQQDRPEEHSTSNRQELEDQVPSPLALSWDEGLITHPSLTSFPFLFPSLTRLLMFPGIASQIYYLHLKLCLKVCFSGNPNGDTFILTLANTQITCKRTHMCRPIYI